MDHGPGETPIISAPLPSPHPPWPRSSTGGVGTGLGVGRSKGKPGLLTNGPGVRRLREVLGHLPVDVKPAESKEDRGEVGTEGWPWAAGDTGRLVSHMAQQVTPLPRTSSSKRPVGHPF